MGAGLSRREQTNEPWRPRRARKKALDNKSPIQGFRMPAHRDGYFGLRRQRPKAFTTGAKRVGRAA